MATSAELIKELKKLGAKLTGKETGLELSRMLKNVTKTGSVAPLKTQIDEGDLIVWLKSKVYVSDTERLDAGVYKMKEVPARLSKLSADFIEVFDGEVSSKKMAQIARWAGVNPDGLGDEEIFELVINRKATPYK